MNDTNITSENCDHDCSGCGSSCGEREEAQSMMAAPNPLSKVGKVIGVVSGKGGVGKSMITSMLAVRLKESGCSVGILDADVTGPSIPRAFGVTEKATGSELGVFPVPSQSGIELISINLLLENDTDPVVWRGPIIAGTVKQFWTDVIWKDIDYLMVDMPPGTGDVPLTVFQSLPLDGILIVTSPQDLVAMIVSKAVKMAQMMNVPILGLIENMSYVECPDCGSKINVFGDSHVDSIATEYGLEVLAKLPINPSVAQACDAGKIEDLSHMEWLDSAVKKISSL